MRNNLTGPSRSSSCRSPGEHVGKTADQPSPRQTPIPALALSYHPCHSRHQAARDRSQSTGNQYTSTATSNQELMGVAGGQRNGKWRGQHPPHGELPIATERLPAPQVIGGQSVAVREDGVAPSTLDIAPASASFGKDSATGTFAVTAGDQCQWAAASNVAVDRSHIGQHRDRQRDGRLLSRKKPGAHEPHRNDFGGQPHVHHHAAADTPPPARIWVYGRGEFAPVEFTPCMSVWSTMTATITTQAGSTWTAEPDASWITLTGGQSGTGPGVVTFRVSDNWDAPRQSVVELRWPTVTAQQERAAVLPGRLFYAVSTAAINVAPAGGPGRFDVIQVSRARTRAAGRRGSACLWTAQSDVPWIAVTTSMPQAGDNAVSFTVAANATTTARTGRITVRDKIVQITQAGQ